MGNNWSTWSGLIHTQLTEFVYFLGLSVMDKLFITVYVFTVWTAMLQWLSQKFVQGGGKIVSAEDTT